jgi:hypothetical protein
MIMHFDHRQGSDLSGLIILRPLTKSEENETFHCLPLTA